MIVPVRTATPGQEYPGAAVVRPLPSDARLGCRTERRPGRGGRYAGSPPRRPWFTRLAAHQRTVYLVVVSLAVLAAGLLISPVVLHRVLFRQNARETLVFAGQRFALAGFATLGLAVVGVVTLIFDVVLGIPAALVAGGVTFVVFLAMWALGPLAARRFAEDDETLD